MFIRIENILKHTIYNKNEVNYKYTSLQAFNQRKRNAAMQEIDWNIDYEYYLNNIYEKQCVFCGCVTSGIDRKDSSISYVEYNIQPCCWTCNVGKNYLSIDEFYFHLQKIFIKHVCL
jgi:hypothetical protein